MCVMSFFLNTNDVISGLDSSWSRTYKGWSLYWKRFDNIPIAITRLYSSHRLSFRLILSKMIGISTNMWHILISIGYATYHIHLFDYRLVTPGGTGRLISYSMESWGMWSSKWMTPPENPAESIPLRWLRPDKAVTGKNCVPVSDCTIPYSDIFVSCPRT
jgi:hypothetical protein